MAKKILIVEDVEDSRAILVLMLQKYCGYETCEAATGLEAVEKAVAEKPDLIVMDLGLPDISGVEAAITLKANPVTAGIPIVAHTAWHVDQWGDKVRSAGMADYLQKPVSIRVMKEAIEKLLPRLPACSYGC